MLKDQLCQIGFTENESVVYLELLKLGPQAASTIAKKTLLNRTTTYSILKAIEKKGVVSSCINNNIRIYHANDPNCLIGYLDQQCQVFDYYKTELLASIPKYRSLVSDYKFEKPVVSYFDGVEGVKYVMNDALNTEDVTRAYCPLPKWLGSGLKNFLLEYKDIRIMNKKVALRAITPDTVEVRAFFKNNYDAKNIMTKFLFVDESMYPGFFENEMSIYDDKVAIMHLDKGEEYGVLIQDPQVSAMHKIIFDMAWSGFELKNCEKLAKK